MMLVPIAVSKLLEKIRSLEAGILEFEGAVKRLRSDGKDWEHDIEKDERATVKLLYKNLVRLREQLKELLACEIKPASGEDEKFENLMRI